MRTSLSDSQTFFTQSRVSHLGLQFPYVDNERTEFQRDLEVCMCVLVVQSYLTVQPHGLQPSRLLCPWNSPGKNTGVNCSSLLQCMKVKSKSEVAQVCPTLRGPMDCSPAGSSVHGILQARILEWVTMPSSRGSSQPRDQTQVSCISGRFFPN